MARAKKSSPAKGGRQRSTPSSSSRGKQSKSLDPNKDKQDLSDVRTDLAEGDPAVSGRTRGRIINADGTPAGMPQKGAKGRGSSRKGAQPDNVDWESGRQQAMGD